MRHWYARLNNYNNDDGDCDENREQDQLCKYSNQTLKEIGPRTKLS